MATQMTLEARVTDLEMKMSRLIEGKEEVDQITPWWNQWFGAFKDSQDFDEAMRHGKRYRESQPNAVDNPDTVEF